MLPAALVAGLSSFLSMLPAALVAGLFMFDEFVVVEFVVPDEFVVVVVVVEAVFVVAVFAGFVFALFAGAVSPQAPANKPTVMIAERAITFFICKILLSSSKIVFCYFTTALGQSLSSIVYFGTIDNIKGGKC
jgi:hypothetical protein